MLTRHDLQDALARWLLGTHCKYSQMSIQERWEEAGRLLDEYERELIAEEVEAVRLYYLEDGD